MVQNIMRDVTGYFTIEQLIRLFNIAKDKNLTHYTIFYALYHSGRRVTELLNLTVKDIDFDKGRIAWSILKRRRYLKNDKGEKMRYPEGHKKQGQFVTARVPTTVFLSAKKELMVVLKAYIKYAEVDREDKLFPMTRQNVFKYFRKYCEQVNIHKIGNSKPHPHHLRHSFAVHFVESNPEMTVKQTQALQHFLQHKNIDSTYTYLQFGKGLYDEALEKMPKI